MPSQQHILEGYKVLDMTQFIAGPTLTRLLAQTGAEVIKVEQTPYGDPTRVAPIYKDGHSSYFSQHNRGKKSLCVNAKDPEGSKIIKDLLTKVDVLAENFTPGVMAKLGLDYDHVREINPRIVMCSISTFGQSGPLAFKPGFDPIGGCYAGIVSMVGEPGGPPYPLRTAMGDVMTAVHAYGAIGYALLHRERTGRGQFLEATLLDSYFHCHEESVVLASSSHGEIKPRRAGLHHETHCPVGLFKGREHYLFIIAITLAQWKSLCQAMGKPELGDDPRFKTEPGRVAHKQFIIDTIQGWLASMPSDEAAVAAMEAHHVPVAPVLSVEEAIDHPHLRQRGTVRTITDPLLGEYQVPGFPFRFSDFPDELALETPTLGQHNAEILERYLGYSPDKIAQLEDAGVLCRYKNTEKRK
ncbi:MAG TPA: CoA transferase [Candidatus Binataceae bacterium]|jgi:CoA:oxalate CoA-transferase|nr:CoA transferase [Candidatus Binataceae bacterium]